MIYTYITIKKFEALKFCISLKFFEFHIKMGGGGAKYINVYPLHEKAKIYIYINIH